MNADEFLDPNAEWKGKPYEEDPLDEIYLPPDIETPFEPLDVDKCHGGNGSGNDCGEAATCHKGFCACVILSRFEYPSRPCHWHAINDDLNDLELNECPRSCKGGCSENEDQGKDGLCRCEDGTLVVPLIDANMNYHHTNTQLCPPKNKVSDLLHKIKTYVLCTIYDLVTKVTPCLIRFTSTHVYQVYFLYISLSCAQHQCNAN